MNSVAAVVEFDAKVFEVAGARIESSAKNATTDEADSLLGYVANSLDTSAFWSKRPNNDQQQEEKSLKNIYNYATPNCANDNNKTAMCRIAEITRYHRLKHEYVLMDETGPAHMKFFTVKLVLRTNEEYIGEGPSIKKAQEAAAEAALHKTLLKVPPSRNRNRSELDPVILLNQLAYQLDLSVEYESETICVPIKMNSSSVTRSSKFCNDLIVNSSAVLQNVPTKPVHETTGLCPPHFPLFLTGIAPPPIPPHPFPSFCSNLSLLLPPKSTATTAGNVFALNSNLMVSPPSPPPATQPQQPLETIHSMLYQQISNSCNNNKNKNFLTLPHSPHLLTQQQQRDLQKNDNHEQKTTRAKIFENRFTIFPPLFLASPVDSHNNEKKPSNNSHNFNTSAINSANNKSIPPLFYRSVPPPPFYAANSINPNILPPAFHHSPTMSIHSTSKNIYFGNDNANLVQNVDGDSKTKLNKLKNLRVFRVTLRLGDESKHSGIGADKTTAKASAATRALHYLRPLLENLQDEIKQNGHLSSIKVSILKNKNQEILDVLPKDFDEKLSIDKSEEANDSDKSSSDFVEKENFTLQSTAKKKKKSIISLIHECAIQLRMNVEFEDISVVGKAHNRQFTVRCRFVSPRNGQVIEADGKGSSKKWAKQDACQMIYDKVKKLEKDPVYLASLVVKKSRRTLGTYQSKSNNKRKILVKQRRSDPQYGQWVNPVCRLMQVMQSNGKPDPVFKLLGEHSHSKFKEFIVQVTCSEMVAEGRSQNKRLAKRAAADEMLRMLGYAKEMPPPGKSLLKKSKEVKSMDVGVFEPTDFSSSFDDNASEKSYCFVNEDENIAKRGDIETFADVDVEMLKVVEQPFSGGDWIHVTSRPDEFVASPNEFASVRAESSSPISSKKSDETTIRKRRVTFNNQVSACPPPDDANYPEASIAPLKSEVLFVSSRLRKRGRDSKKVLTDDEKQILASVTKIFLKHQNQSKTQQEESNSPPQRVSPNGTDNNANALESAKSFLDVIAKTHKFSVIYSDFPKTDDKQCFSLVTLGIDKPIVCPGNGCTEDEAHENAAFNAIKELSGLEMASLQNS